MDAVLRPRDFHVEIDAVVVDHEPSLMSHVRLPQFFVFIDSLGRRLIPCCFVDRSIEIACPICGSDQVEHCVVPVLSELYGTCAQLIEEGLPRSLAHMGGAIKQATVYEHDNMLVLDHRPNVNKAIF